MNDNSIKLITNEVIDFFLRGDDALIESLKNSEIFPYAVWDLISDDELLACEEKEYFDRGVQRDFKNLLFLTKAKLLLPKIFNISKADCISGLKNALRMARCELLALEKNFDPKKSIEFIKSSWAKERTVNSEREYLIELKKKLEVDKGEYIRSQKEIDNAPDHAIGQGYSNPKLDASFAYVANYQQECKKFEYNEEALRELSSTEDEICLLQDGYIISPCVFKKHNLGFDVSTLKFTSDFAYAYTKHINFAKTSVSTLQEWEKVLCRMAGKEIKRSYKKKTDKPDKYGNVQVSIFNNPDAQKSENETE